MPVQSDTELIWLRGWTARIRRAAVKPARLLMLVHGWTGDENSMWVFAQNLPSNKWIVAPRAPHKTEPGGYSWRPALRGPHERPTFDDLKPAVGPLLSFLDAYAAENELDASQFDAMGFSQGAALVNTLALLHPERIGRLAVLAGFLPAGAEPCMEGRPLDGKSIFVAHGTLDETVPVEVARRSVKLLQDAGANVTYCEDEVGHKLSAGCLRALQVHFA